MAARVRLKRVGTKKKPHFKIVVVDRRSGRGARSIEELGFYDPSHNPPMVKINKERAAYWIGKGAEVSDTVKDIIRKTP